MICFHMKVDLLNGLPTPNEAGLLALLCKKNDRLEYCGGEPEQADTGTVLYH